MNRNSSASETDSTKPELMQTIKFTNKERILIGDDHVKYMDALKPKLPNANYSDDE